MIFDVLYCSGKRNKSELLTREIAPHSGEFASFKRRARSNPPLYPEYRDAGLSSFHRLVHKTHVRSQDSAAAKWEKQPVITKFSTFLTINISREHFFKFKSFYSIYG